jgi:taurine--2-oxoglutarate transaminase
MLSRYRAYHGGTATSMSLSAGDARSWAQVLGGTELVHVPQPYCYRCMFGQKYRECDLRCVKYIDEVIEQVYMFWHAQPKPLPFYSDIC